jgi:hypothetical protein
MEVAASTPTTRPPAIIHFGLTFADLEEEDEVQPQPVVYDKAPHSFTSIDKWITHTNLKCLGCGLSFEHRPAFVPASAHTGTTEADGADNTDTYIVKRTDLLVQLRCPVRRRDCP